MLAAIVPDPDPDDVEVCTTMLTLVQLLPPVPVDAVISSVKGVQLPMVEGIEIAIAGANGAAGD